MHVWSNHDVSTDLQLPITSYGENASIDLRVTLCSELLNILAASTGFMVHAACGINHIDDTINFTKLLL